MGNYWIIHVIWVSLVFIQQASTQCPQDQGQSLFGDNCQYPCHCINGTQCDLATGECTDGCAHGWTGSACQNRDIAFEKYSRQLDNTNRILFAFYANDGDINTCSETNYASAGSSRILAPLWRVYFDRIQVVRMIILSARLTNLNDFVGGFNITVENITDLEKRYNDYYPVNSKLCYQHEANKQLNSTFEVHCGEDLVGNQVRIQLSSKHTQLSICDVKIYGDCSDGFYGERCSSQCSFYCIGGFQNCQESDGCCSLGCLAGWTGNNCKKECSDGIYGEGCTSECSKNCKGGIRNCRKTDGTCIQGCLPGWSGNNCSKVCPDGRWGDECLMPCSVHCEGGQTYCNHQDGHCVQGCVAGWTTDNCTQECPDGRWGVQCAQTCGECLFATCNKYNGVCPGLCKSGYEPATVCNKKCQDGQYGFNCSQTCSSYCLESMCNHIDGHCTYGCVSGRTEANCTLECPNFSYGVNCSGQCGGCKFGRPCNIETGICPIGCAKGYHGTLCINEEDTVRSNTAIVAAVAGGSGVVIVGLIIVIILLILNHRRQKNPTQAPTEPLADHGDTINQYEDLKHSSSPEYDDITQI